MTRRGESSVEISELSKQSFRLTRLHVGTTLARLLWLFGSILRKMSTTRKGRKQKTPKRWDEYARWPDHTDEEGDIHDGLLEECGRVESSGKLLRIKGFTIFC